MATTSRQSALFGTEDWKRIYKTYKEADFQSYNFETIRKTFVDYLRQHHPESFNDYTESSEFVAILDLMAFMGQSLSFRNDLNTRENFLDTAERRDSVERLAKLVGYTPKRNESAAGYLKLVSVKTTEKLSDYNQLSISNTTIKWDDVTNDDWQEQFATILNAVLVNSQRIGKPGNSQEVVGVKTDEYEINMADGFLPVIPFNSTVDGVAMDFEIVNGTSQNTNYIYEPTPVTNGALNLLFRDDNLGFASPNTGYFFFFKQGTLATQDFSLSDRISNRSVDIDISGINENDVWLFKDTNGIIEQWNQVENIYASNNDQTDATERKLYSLTSRTNDQITLNFGDGVFSEQPIGNYRAQVRSSNGLEYVIDTSEIQNVEVALNYISKTGRTETATFTVSLTVSVSNAKNRETLGDIKRRAPARYYTQNRMVNGEDYNNFPFATFNSIIKSKAVNRSNIGASRYLDLVDPTGKFSSINTFGDDGLLYQDTSEKSFNFTFNDRNDIQSVINNQVEPLISGRSILHFYYANFNRFAVAADTSWNQSTTITNETTGFFSDVNSSPTPLGTYTSTSNKYIVPGALVKFTPPVLFGVPSHFDENNKVQEGPVTSPSDKLEIWAGIKSQIFDGTNFGAGNLADGIGPVVLNNFVPTGAVAVESILPFNSNIAADIESSIVLKIEAYEDFGLGYNNETASWYEIDLNNVAESSIATFDNAISSESSWVIKFIASENTYTVTARTLNYHFASVSETRFFHDETTKIFDIKKGKTVNDYIKILKTNGLPDPTLLNSSSLPTNITLDIIAQSVESDGFVNDFDLEVSFADIDSDGIADDPDFFNTFVSPLITPETKNVFFEDTIDFDNLERTLPLEPGTINTEYATLDAIARVKTEYATGQVFYATSEGTFYELFSNVETVKLTQRTNLSAKVGRGNVQFQYKHNSPNTRRINPGVSNIIDIYVVTSAYYDEFTRYIQDSTNTVSEPEVPSSDSLQVAYRKLQEHRMISDNVILNSVKFKPIIGSKSATALQAYIKVVKVANSNTSDSEIKSRIILAVNDYFDISIWDFGDTFYFSELSSYLHTKLGDVVASIVITSKDPLNSFGDLYEIKSQPNEIFTSAATVDDIIIIDALTASNIQTGNN